MQKNKFLFIFLLCVYEHICTLKKDLICDLSGDEAGGSEAREVVSQGGSR